MVLAWVIGVMILGGVTGAIGTNYRSDFTLPDVESKHGIDILDERFGGQGAGVVGNIVFRAEQGVHDPRVRQPMVDFLARVAAIPMVQSVSRILFVGRTNSLPRGAQAIADEKQLAALILPQL